MLRKLQDSEESILHTVINTLAFYEAQIQLITRRRLLFNYVTWPEYQALLCTVNPMVEDLLLKSATTIPVHIDHSFKLHQEIIRARIQSVKSLIHLSSDLWSSLNRKAFIRVHV